MLKAALRPGFCIYARTGCVITGQQQGFLLFELLEKQIWENQPCQGLTPAVNGSLIEDVYDILYTLV